MGCELHVAREQVKCSSCAMATSGDQQQGYSGVGAAGKSKSLAVGRRELAGAAGAVITRLPWDSATLFT